jgi:hypothetical protein
MPQLKIMGFDGIVPRASPTMLGDNQAQIADNVKLYSRELRYWRGPLLSYTPPISGVKAIYRYYASTPSPYTLTWTNDVDVVTSPTTDTTDYRLYYTGDGVPKKTNETLVSTGTGAYPRGWRNMGVPAPAAAPTTTVVSAGSAVTVTAATPAVVTLNDHGFADGQEVVFNATTMPTGITAGKKYKVRNHTTHTFELGTSENATSSVAATTTGSGVKVFTYAENRVYVYTYVSTFGSITEESAPSPASGIITLYSGDTVNISGFSTAPTTNYNITAIRIYRSVTGATTDSYEFVDQIPVTAATGVVVASGTSTNGVAYSSSTYPDLRTAAQLGEALGTIGWLPPPSDLAGLVSLPSGTLAGFSGNTVYFSEPFFPHAWPLDYALNVPHKVVGLAVFGTSVAVMTERFPYIINGGTPGDMSVERVPMLEPCVSKRSIVALDGGALYASPNGLMAVGFQQRSLVTNSLFRRDEWQQVVPGTIIAATFDGKYLGAYASDSTSFVLSPDDVPALSRIDLLATALHTDTKTGDLYYCSAADNKVYKFDADENNPLYYEWKSKRFVFPQATTFSVLKLDGDYNQATLAAAYQQQVAEILAYNQAHVGDPGGELNRTVLDLYDVNGSILLNVPPAASARSAQVYLYGDGDLHAALTLTSFDPVRIPPFKSRDIEIRLVGNLNVRSVQVATTVLELRQ